MQFDGAVSIPQLHLGKVILPIQFRQVRELVAQRLQGSRCIADLSRPDEDIKVTHPTCDRPAFHNGQMTSTLDQERSDLALVQGGHDRKKLISQVVLPKRVLIVG